ncbi:replication initiation protein [Limosilactobacillus reuteri]|uniref:replication initiation protein n=1 Tax=Limosilactobacillus reuteri TaxID=1598 RepID=UPI000A2D5D58|nr:replication initiation protein [Limosilactobacillus reuteri]OTA48591.1 hypothetical protein BHL90_09135 [Limosilactobacillus reuteri]
MSREDKAKLVDRTVIEHNDLITSVAKMDKVPMKMFELAVSYVNVHEPLADNTVHLSKREMFAFFGVNDTNKSFRFKKAIERMQQQAYFEIQEVKGKKGYKYRRIVPIPYVEWNDYDDDVVVRFDQAIIPYIIDLKKNFTQYALTDIMKLSSKYAVVLYRWLSMNFAQYKYYRDHGGRTRKQIERLQNPTISVEELRRITDTKDEYARMSVFTRWILQKPCDEITAHTHLNVKFEKIKSGRRISEVQFFVTEKPLSRLNHKDDELADEMRKKARKDDSELYIASMQSPFTKMLTDAQIIFSDDLMNQKVMTYLYRHVYPQYEKIIKLSGGGIAGRHRLQDHLRYVSNRRIPNMDKRKNNIGRYLDVAANQYIIQIKVKED